MRTITQLTAMEETETGDIYLYAACDDGTLWMLDGHTVEQPWKELPPVPQVPSKYPDRRDTAAMTAFKHRHGALRDGPT